MRFFLTFQGGENFGKIGQISVRKPQISGKSGRESSDKETPVFCIFRDFRDFRDFGQISGFRGPIDPFQRQLRVGGECFTCDVVVYMIVLIGVDGWRENGEGYR